MFPHLSDIARKFRDKGLKVVGISLEEPSSSLEQFVNGQGPKMDYTVHPLAWHQGSCRTIRATEAK